MSAAAFPTWVDGRLVAAGRPALGADAAGLGLGLGLFETLLALGGERRQEEEHLARMARGARFLGLPFRPESGRRALADYAAALGPAGVLAEPGLVLRLTLLAGGPGAAPHLVVSARRPEPPPADGAELVLEPRSLLARDPLGALKTVARVRHVLARRRAQEHGAFDALLGSDEGDVLEASSSNLFVVRDGRLLTPDLARGCLPGITRARLLAAWRAAGRAPEESRVEPGDLARAQEIFLTNSVAGVIPVLGVRGLTHDLPGPGGPWTALARTLLAASAPAVDKGS